MGKKIINLFPLRIIIFVCILQVVLSASIGSRDAKSSTLQMAAVIFRHGDRAPTDLYPNDPHKDHVWPGGLGSLSQKGSLQHYNLGINLKKRYGELLPSDGLYTTEQIHVLSSSAERCLMSAQSFLAGFMPPQVDKNNLPISWQPVPVNSIPRENDEIVAQRKACKKYDALLAQLNKDPPEDVKEMNKKNKDLYDLLTKETGKKMKKVSDITKIYKTLLIEQSNGLKLPEWTKGIFPERMLPFAERDFALLTETDYMKQVKAGPYLTDVYNKMVLKQKKTLNPNRKLFLYSGHDGSLINVMNTLNVISQTARFPDYASAFVIELHSNPSLPNDLEVQLKYYANSKQVNPKKVVMPSCKEPCSLKTFGDNIKKFLVEDFDGICENRRQHEPVDIKMKCNDNLAFEVHMQ